MDDVALLSSSREEAQRALNAASSWADSILREPMVSLRVHGQPLPEVDSYRYLGGILHWAGSHGPLLDDLQSRLRSKTGQFLRWVWAKQVPISLLCQLWAVYVEPIAKFLLPTIALSRSELQKVDLIQRKLAGMILGLPKRSPIPWLLKLRRREITFACIIFQLRQWLWPYRKDSARQ